VQSVVVTIGHAPLQGSAARAPTEAAGHPAVLLWSANESHGCTWCDDHWLGFTGLTQAEALADGWLEVLHPDDRDRCFVLRARHFAAHTAFELEYQLRRADGEYRSILERASPRRDPGGTSSDFLGSCLDVTDVRAIPAELSRRVGQRAALADLGRAGLQGEAFPELAQRAADLVAPALGAPFASVYERISDDTLRLRALSGLPDDLIGARVPIDDSSSVGAAAARNMHLTVPDWEAEPRFGGRDAALRQGILATAAAVLRSPSGPVGVLAVHAAAAREFEPDEMNFLRSVANVLGAALTRERSEAEREQLLTSVRSARDELEATVARLDTLLEQSPVAFAFCDRDFRFVRVNRPLAAMDGIAVTAHLGHTIGELLPDLWSRIGPTIQAVVEGGPPIIDLELGGQRPESGVERYFSLSAYPVRGPSNEILGLGAVALEITERKQAELAANLVSQATELLVSTPDVETTLQEAVELAVPVFADSCHLYYQPGDQELRVAIAHRDEDVRARLLAAHERWPLDLEVALPSDLPPRSAHLLAEVTPSMRGHLATDPAHRAIVDEHAVTSAILAPLFARGARVGLLVFNYTEDSGRRYRPADVELAEALAERLAEWVDAARLRAEARRAEERVALLAQTGALVTLELDSDARMEGFVDLTVPTFADLCVVNTIDDDGSFRMAQVAVAPGYDEQFAVLREWEPITPDMPSVSADAVRTRAPVLLEDAQVLIDALAPDRRALAERAGIESLLCVPMFDSADDAFGTVTFAMAGSRRRYRPDDVPIAEELGRRGAAALRHARTFERERDTVEALQRSLLPAELPSLGDVEISVSYLPAAEGALGGDWYDVVPLADGRLILAIGDVVGHGVAAATSTGRLRAGLQLCALDGDGPSEILLRLNRYLHWAADAEMATLSVVRYDPSTGALELASAGHPPPLVLDDRGPHYLDHDPGPPLRATSSAVYRTTRAQLPADGTLLLYTDGLIERRREPIDVGLGRLLAATQGPVRGLDQFTEQILDALLPDRRADDDVALVLLRTHPAGFPLTVELPAWPRELARLRRVVRGWLRHADVADDIANEIVVAVNEAGANAVQHAYGLEDSNFTVQARIERGTVVLDVRDHGRWRTAQPEDQRGWGLELIHRLMDVVAVESTDQGTVVHFERRLTRAPAS
jgi:PAS domain S-box-containing protein